MAARLRMRMHPIMPKPYRSSRLASHALSKPRSLLATCTYVRQEGRMRARLMRVPRATQQPHALLSCIFARLRGCDRRAAVHRGQRPPQWHSDSIASTARAGRLRRVSGGCEGVQSVRHTQTESATFLCMPQQLYMWRGSEAARRNHDEQGDCAMHRAERDGEYPRTIGERKRSSRPVNRRNGSEGSVRSSPCRHATSRLTVHCRQACHRSNAVRDRVEYHVGDFSCRT